LTSVPHFIILPTTQMVGMSAKGSSTHSSLSLGDLVLKAALANAERTAFDVAGTAVSYAELLDRAGRIARAVAGAPRALPPLGAIFAQRGAVAYTGIFGTLLAGAGYVPLNPKFPDERTAWMLAESGATSLVTEAALLERCRDFLRDRTAPLSLIVPDLDDTASLARELPAHRVLGQRELSALEPVREAVAVERHDIAYLMFTSGTTGRPKGVMVTHENVLHHLTTMWERYAIGPDDRLSQTFDLTFDLSVFDLFMAWGRGASFHTFTPANLLAPAKRIGKQGLTVWFSVPSVGMLMRGLHQLKAGALPSLRVSLFCGERLPQEVAAAWAEAAPRSIVENLYGPTEVTIACTLYRWDSAVSPGACVGGVVPIGTPYPGMKASLVNERLERVAPGEHGELCMCGPQVSAGYFKDEAKTRDKFVSMPWDDGPTNRWYRTGDLAYLDARGDLIHAGRNDEQVKIRGYRIEVAEIEHVLRQSAASDFVAVVPLPLGAPGAPGLVAFVAGSTQSDEALLTAARHKLPDYMVPSEIARLPALPLNANGKVDRKALRELLEKRHDDAR
jgi:amino acid adenylation domain-containing protein